MKKLLFILAFTLLSFTTFSQVKVRPGLRLGANMSKISNSYTEDYKSGLNASIFLNVRFSNFYALQPEIFYSNQGGKGSIVGVEDFSVDYVGIAIANHFFVIENLGLHFIVGPSLDLNFDDNWVNLINDDSDLYITPLDFSFFGGIGYEFPFGLSIEARYKQGLIDIDAFDDYYNNDGFYYENDENQLNSVIQIGVAYKFSF